MVERGVQKSNALGLDVRLPTIGLDDAFSEVRELAHRGREREPLGQASSGVVSRQGRFRELASLQHLVAEPGMLEPSDHAIEHLWHLVVELGRGKVPRLGHARIA
ncbi:MAG TPA: hypothetical protein VLM85_30410 [Polyangiaceae bacterium]|nr:hypothetical protein [Polyangiaceae bacterium]